MARSDRLLPEDVNLDEESKTLWRAVRGELGSARMIALRNDTPCYHLLARLCRQSDRSDPIEIIDRLIMWMAAAGWDEASLRQIELHVRTRIDQCFAGNALPKPEQIDESEQVVGGEENVLQLHRLRSRADGTDVAPTELLREAQVRRELAAIQLVSARSLERDARGRRRAPVIPIEVRA